jgi:hypothetical protein
MTFACFTNSLWTGYFEALQAVAGSAGVKLVPGAVRDRDDISRSIGAFADTGDDGLLVPPDAVTTEHQQLIFALANRHRLPAVYPYRFWADVGSVTGREGSLVAADVGIFSGAVAIPQTSPPTRAALAESTIKVSRPPIAI